MIKQLSPAEFVRFSNFPMPHEGYHFARCLRNHTVCEIAIPGWSNFTWAIEELNRVTFIDPMFR